MNKLNEKNVMILGDLTHKLDMLKKDSASYSIEEFEEKFNEIKNLFEIHKLPFKYSFDSYISNLDFKVENDSYTSSYEEEVEEEVEEYDDESYSYSYSYDDE